MDIKPKMASYIKRVSRGAKVKGASLRRACSIIISTLLFISKDRISLGDLFKFLLGVLLLVFLGITLIAALVRRRCRLRWELIIGSWIALAIVGVGILLR